MLVNRELERQFGYAREELVGQSRRSAAARDARARSSAAAAPRLRRRPAPRPMGAGRELVGRRKDGSQYSGRDRVESASDGGWPLRAGVDRRRHRARRMEAAARGARGAARVRTVRRRAVGSVHQPSRRADRRRHPERSAAHLRRRLGLDRGTFFRIGNGRRAGRLRRAGRRPASRRSSEPPGALRTVSVVDASGCCAGEVVSFSSARRDSRRDRPRAVTWRSATSRRSSCRCPVDGRVEGAVGFNAVRAERTWSPEVVAPARPRSPACSARSWRGNSATRRCRAAAEAQRAEGCSCRSRTCTCGGKRASGWGRSRVVGQSAAVRRVLEQIEQVAATDSTVLLLGETGTGKELFATQIHELGPRHEPGDGAGELRGDSGDAHRKRAVRPRERARSRERWRGRSAASSWPITRRSFSTRSAICRSTCR